MNSAPNTIKSIKAKIADGAHVEAFNDLCVISNPKDDFPLQSKYLRLFRSLDLDVLGLASFRVAIAGSSSSEHLADLLRFYLAREGYLVEIFVAEFGTLEPSLLDPNSRLYAFKPDAVWLQSGYRDVHPLPDTGATADLRQSCLDGATARFQNLWKSIQVNSRAFVLQNNADLPPERSFGNFEAGAPWSRTNFLRLFNVELARLRPNGVGILDLDYLSSLYGKDAWFDDRYWYHSKNSLSFDALGMLCFHVAKALRAAKGESRKALVLDLDNTLWGGVIGDDGVSGIALGNDRGAAGEAFVAFQDYILSLKNRGIILTVCSKNEDAAARKPFEEHPDMRLRLDDIAVFRANWKNKADNIREIASTLNIGLDSLVFVDDNPAERDLVRGMLPMVAVPEMPEDPTEYVRVLDQQAYFETAAYTQEDGARNVMYRNNAQRKELEETHSDLSSYLKALDMEAYVGEMDALHLPRMAQLINKSNQFNLTTIRRSESDLQSLHEQSDIVFRFFKLRDKFGDNGLISVVLLKVAPGDTLVIDTWVMSCRVLSRGMEEFILDEIVSVAQSRGCSSIIGHYRETKKNNLVASLYERLGFNLLNDAQEGGSNWELELKKNSTRKYFISRLDSYISD